MPGPPASRATHLALPVEQLREAAPYHALAVERRFRSRLHARVVHGSLQTLVARGFVRPLHEREDDALVCLGLHGALEIGHLAVGHVVAPRFDDPRRTILLEDLGS